MNRALLSMLSRHASCRFARLIVSLCLLGLSACDHNDTSVSHAHIAHHTSITALIWAPDWPEQMLQIADEFNQRNPDITVNVQFMIGNSVEQNIKPRVATGNLPELMSVNPNSYAAELAEQGVLADVSATAAWNNMLDNLKQDWSTPGNKHFGISGGVASTLMYYNKDMFAKAGISALPTNFDEFLKICDQLKRAGFTPIVWNGGFPNMLGNGPFSAGFGNNVVAHEPAWRQKIADGSLNLNTPQVADIFAKIALIAERGYTQRGYMNTNYDEAIKQFAEGKTAMAYQGNWASAMLMHARGFQTGVFLPPWNDADKTAVPVVGSETGFAVGETPNKAAAMRFLEFIAAQGFTVIQKKRHSISPFKQPAGAGLSDPQIAAYTDMVRSYPLTVGLYYSFLPANTIELLHLLMQDVLLKKITPRQAAKLLNDSIQHEAKMHFK